MPQSHPSAKLSLLFATALAALASGPAWSQPKSAEEWAPGRLIVMQRAGGTAAELQAALKPHGGKSRRLGKSDLHVVELPAGMPETTVQRLLQRHPALKFAELDRKAPRLLQANDPYLGSQWHLAMVRAPAAWDGSRGNGVTIAVLDGGVLATHPDLQTNLLTGYNAWDGGTDTADINNHGTAVAGAAAAALNNSIGVSGVAGGARIQPIRITDNSGTAWYSTIASGVVYAADRGIRVVNCSYGWLFKSAAVQSAGNYLKGKGGLLVVSAGNAGADEQAAATASMITVSATDGGDQLAGWSSWGQMVSVSAPGVGIWTTAANGGYESANGTSFAAPVVAGVVALMMSANPALSAGQVESLLYSSAADLGTPGRDVYFGWGRVNADAAVRAALASTSTDTARPTAVITSPAGSGTVSGSVAVDVAASDNVGVTRVELRAAGALVATDNAAPFRLTWDSTAAGNGSVALVAVAYDAAGNSQESDPVNVWVANATQVDVTAPTVSIGNPADGARVSGTVSLWATASDNAGPAGLRLALLINGVQRASSTGSTLNFAWNTRKEKDSSFTVAVVASDASGNKTTRQVSVTRSR